MSGDSISEVPWSGTVALPLGGVPAAGTEDFISGTLADVAETVAACLLASRFRVAHVGDLGGDGVSERLLAWRVPTVAGRTLSGTARSPRIRELDSV